MAAVPETTREEDCLKRDRFRRNAFLIIEKMLLLSSHPSELVDEALHSIFFLGEIMTPPNTPKDILTDVETLNVLKEIYPRPFALCSSQLPRRSPMSCVLDMIISQTGQNDPDDIKQKLRELMLTLKQGPPRKQILVSSTICISENITIPNPVKYYGVSMSTFGCYPGRIIVAASCLSGNWDSYVAGAVMSFDLDKKEKNYFNGRIKLPKSVRCEAFRLSDGKKMPPCKACQQLFFGLETSEEKKKEKWAYGNCAEVESVSNLFKNDKEVREQARPTHEKCTDVNRQKARESIKRELKCCLKNVPFTWDENFYTPQVVVPF